MNLKEAIIKGKLKEFIKQHSDKEGDKPAFDATVSSMVGKLKEAQEASPKDSDEN